MVFLCHINPLFLLQYTNAKIPPTHISHHSNSLFVEFSLIPHHLAHPTLQFVAEDLRSCTVSILLFDWDFLIHTFSPLTAPAAKKYQKEQTICAVTSYYPCSLFHLMLTDGTAVMHQGNSPKVHLFLIIQDTFMRRKICWQVKCIDVDCRERAGTI